MILKPLIWEVSSPLDKKGVKSPMNFHMMSESVGHVADAGAKLVGVPVATFIFLGVDVQIYIMYGTAILDTVSLMKLAHNTGKKIYSTYKSVRQRFRDRKSKT